MAILIDRNTRVITQGIFEPAAQAATRICREYANGRQCFVAGVDREKAGQSFEGMPEGMPVYASVSEARTRTGATVSVIYAPPLFAAAAIDEAVDAGMELVVCVTGGIPAPDMARTLDRMKGRNTRLVGPNSPGIISPGEIMVGTLPAPVHRKGTVGVVSCSAPLACDVVDQLTHLGLGQSTCIGLGDGSAGSLDFIDVMQMFNEDPDTEVVVMTGAIAGDAEERCARWIRDNGSKPVVAFVPDGSAAEKKLAVMEECGVVITRDRPEIGLVVRSVIYDDAFWMIG